MFEIQFERILFESVAVYFCFVLIQLSKASNSIAVIWSWWHSIQRCSKVRPLVRSICRYPVSLFLCSAFDFVISRHVNRNCHIDLVQHLKLKQSIVVSLAAWLVGLLAGWLTDWRAVLLAALLRWSVVCVIRLSNSFHLQRYHKSMRIQTNIHK